MIIEQTAKHIKYSEIQYSWMTSEGVSVYLSGNG